MKSQTRTLRALSLVQSALYLVLAGCHWSKARCTWFWPDKAQARPILFIWLVFQRCFVFC